MAGEISARLRSSVTRSGFRRAALAPCLACALLACLTPAAGAVTFSNPAPIVIPVQGNAAPYPSPIVVSGLPGTTTDVNVTLSNYTHTDPEDVAAVLVPPSDTNMLLMDGPGGTSEVSGVNITFDDSAPAFMPQATAFPSGSYKPTAYFPGTSFPAPGPLTTYCNPGPIGGGTCTLALALNGKNPNGIWNLYVIDADTQDTGTIAGGWSLDITSAAAQQRTLTVNRGGTGSGTVTATGINCGADCTEAYADGSSVVLTATPAAGSGFASWVGCDNPSANTCTMSMTANKTVTATFNTTPVVVPPPMYPTPVPTPTPTRDTTKPVLSALSLSPSRFRAASSGPSVAAVVGSTVSYGLSEAAAVQFRVERGLRGRRVGGRCVKPTRSNRRAKRCTRYSTLSGGFTHQGKAGSNKLKFSGRVGGRKLRPGSYRLRGVGRDPSGNESALRRSGFRIVRR